MIERKARNKVTEMAQKFPVILLTGPRQSGKTTFCKHVFSTYRYVSLENPDVFYFAKSDPKGFLKQYDKYVIIDEAQQVPELFSYIQQIVDESNITGHYILSGSQNFLLFEKITQSLAGRVYVMDLLPLTHSEIKQIKNQTLFEEIVKGSYPRIYDKNIEAEDFYRSYIQTYIERDVRSIINVQDLNLFKKFLSILAHQTAQLFNSNSISKNLGIDSKTVQRWLSILETSYIVFILQPWHKNFSKRVIKTPKIYFYDVGLVSLLLGIEKAEDLIFSSYKGTLFENFALLEIMKNHKNKGKKNNYYFWRDSNQNEIDLIIEKGTKISCIEFKSSETVKPEFIKNLHYLDNLESQLTFNHFLVNTQEISQERSNETIVSWNDLERIE